MQNGPKYIHIYAQKIFKLYLNSFIVKFHFWGLKMAVWSKRHYIKKNSKALGTGGHRHHSIWLQSILWVHITSEKKLGQKCIIWLPLVPYPFLDMGLAFTHYILYPCLSIFRVVKIYWSMAIHFGTFIWIYETINQRAIMLNCSAVACIVKGHLRRVVTLTFSFPRWSQFSMLGTW